MSTTIAKELEKSYISDCFKELSKYFDISLATEKEVEELTRKQYNILKEQTSDKINSYITYKLKVKPEYSKEFKLLEDVFYLVFLNNEIIRNNNLVSIFPKSQKYLEISLSKEDAIFHFWKVFGRGIPLVDTTGLEIFTQSFGSSNSIKTATEMIIEYSSKMEYFVLRYRNSNISVYEEIPSYNLKNFLNFNNLILGRLSKKNRKSLIHITPLLIFIGLYVLKDNKRIRKKEINAKKIIELGNKLVEKSKIFVMVSKYESKRRHHYYSSSIYYPLISVQEGIFMMYYLFTCSLYCGLYITKGITALCKNSKIALSYRLEDEAIISISYKQFKNILDNQIIKMVDGEMYFVYFEEALCVKESILKKEFENYLICDDKNKVEKTIKNLKAVESNLKNLGYKLTKVSYLKYTNNKRIFNRYIFHKRNYNFNIDLIKEISRNTTIPNFVRLKDIYIEVENDEEKEAISKMLECIKYDYDIYKKVSEKPVILLKSIVKLLKSIKEVGKSNTMKKMNLLLQNILHYLLFDSLIHYFMLIDYLPYYCCNLEYYFTYYNKLDFKKVKNHLEKIINDFVKTFDKNKLQRIVILYENKIYDTKDMLLEKILNELGEGMERYLYLLSFTIDDKDFFEDDKSIITKINMNLLDIYNLIYIKVLYKNKERANNVELIPLSKAFQIIKIDSNQIKKYLKVVSTKRDYPFPLIYQKINQKILNYNLLMINGFRIE